MVDKFMNYSDDVGSLQEAFGFIMDYFGEFDAPNITIEAFRRYEDVFEMADDEKGELRFGVSVSGKVE